MALTRSQLAAAPFHLSHGSMEWVASTFATLTLEEKLGQIILPLCRDLEPTALNRILKYRVGGVHRMPSRGTDLLRESAELLQSGSRVPMLMSADLEMSEKGSFAEGTAFPNQMAVAATGDPDAAVRMATVAAREGAYCGFNVSWTPVLDLALNHRSNVVNTRSFGSDPDVVISFMRSYFHAAAEYGLARVAKHFPGDGVDDRDQHFLTTHNTLSMDEWNATFGRVWRAAVAEGVQMIMPGHITLPAWSVSLGGAARASAYMPATLNPDLLQNLLRGELGFNGVIVSDATSMAGFLARGPRSQTVPACIEAGCDILLFPEDIDEDLGHFRQGLENGSLSMERVDDAVLRILALKASLGLDRNQQTLPDAGNRHERFATRVHRQWAEEIAHGAVTLVKDSQNLLPLDPEKHHRILLATPEGRRGPSGPLPELQISEYLKNAGFEVLRLVPGKSPDPDSFDIGLYVFADEGVSGKEDLSPQWGRLQGDFPLTMERLWFKRPSMAVSLGTPFLLYHLPDCPTLVNAYSPIPAVQRAVVDAITGRRPFVGHSPVDVFCGLPDARL